MLIGGPTILQKLYQEGVPLRIFGTGFTLADLVVFARDGKKIKSLADLKGKQLAADMGGSQYQVLKIYTNAKGIELGKDITDLDAGSGHVIRVTRAGFTPASPPFLCGVADRTATVRAL